MTAPIAPFWMNPSAPGQLSNKRGSNTGADAISLQIKYANSRATGDPIGTLRIVGTKPGSGGAAPVVAVDTGWMGAGTAVNLPVASKVRPNCTFQYNGRVYVCSVDPTTSFTKIFSAAVNGQSIGVWRQEQAPNPPGYSGFLDGVDQPYSMAGANGYVYLANSNSKDALNYAVINGDGTFGAWTTLPTAPNQIAYGVNRQIYTYLDSAGAAYIVVLGAGTNCASAKLQSDGTVTKWQTGAAMTQIRWATSIFLVNNGNGTGQLWLIGGFDNVAPRLDILNAAVTIDASGNPTIGAWGTAGTGLPAARAYAGFAAIPTANSAFELFVIGGTAVAGEAGAGNTTIYRIQSVSLGAAWTTDAVALGTAVLDCGGFVPPIIMANTAVSSGINLWYLTGGGTGGAFNATVQLGKSTHNVNSPMISVANVAVGAELANADLGTGGVVTNNIDGTVTVTYVWQAGADVIGGGGGTALSDGDVVTLVAYTTDQQQGDPGPAGITAFKVGQPPTISGITVLPANDGRPTVSFNYNAVAGGDLEFSYRVQAAPNGFDSAVRYDSANTVQLLTAPYLVTLVAQTITITIVSRDSPMTGSTAQAVSSATVYTPTLTAPGTPSGLTATPNHALGLIALAWTNNAPAGTTPGNRVYYRRNGTSTWYLLFDSAVAITSFNAMDQLAFAVPYDFAVSQVDNNVHSESPLSTAALNKTIDPVQGGYSGFLHIQGQGTVHFAPLLVQGTPDVTAVFDTTVTLPFQQLTPTVTLGVAHYAKLRVTQLVPTLANQKQIMDVIATAYAGNVMVYRDGFGGMITCQIDQDQSEVYLPPVARASTLNLVQIPNQYSPSTAQGSALGYLQQVFNSITPLDPVEAFL